jgi:thymidine kinase|tara:strand:- start:2446 stop:3000 length:555 start_codon:yes stop_codon:yes gene_type:complete
MSLELIIGPMFSGKSTYIIRSYQMYSKKYKTIILNFYKDNRYDEGDFVCTHNNQKEKAVKLRRLSDLDLKYFNNEVFIIDEGHFFNDLLHFVLNLMKLKKKIIVIGLNGDIFGQPFKNVVSLIPYSYKILSFNAICSLCKDDTKGFMHIKKTHNKNNGEFKEVGGEEEYKTVCKYHFDKHNNNH